MMSATKALIARTHESALPLLEPQEQVRRRLLAEEWAAPIEAVHARHMERQCICRNGTLIEPLHHHAWPRRNVALMAPKESTHD